MSVEIRLESKLRDSLSPDHLEVINESGSHNVKPGAESHFKLIVVSKDFEGHSSVSRHRMIYGIVQEEMDQDLHALAIHAYTPEEWEKSVAPNSPVCLGGNSL